jgi:hypothetical protein
VINTRSHRNAPPDTIILLLLFAQLVLGEPDGAVEGHGQPSVSAPYQDGTQDELAAGIPAAAEAEGVERYPHREAHAPVSGNDFEHDVEDGPAQRVLEEMSRLDLSQS